MVLLANSLISKVILAYSISRSPYRPPYHDITLYYMINSTYFNPIMYIYPVIYILVVLIEFAKFRFKLTTDPYPLLLTL